MLIIGWIQNKWDHRSHKRRLIGFKSINGTIGPNSCGDIFVFKVMVQFQSEMMVMMVILIGWIQNGGRNKLIAQIIARWDLSYLKPTTQQHQKAGTLYLDYQHGTKELTWSQIR